MCANNCADLINPNTARYARKILIQQFSRPHCEFRATSMRNKAGLIIILTFVCQ